MEIKLQELVKELDSYKKELREEMINHIDDYLSYAVNEFFTDYKEEILSIIESKINEELEEEYDEVELQEPKLN